MTDQHVLLKKQYIVQWYCA